MKLGNHLDFSQYEARNLVIQSLSSAPSAPKQFQIYGNLSSAVPFYWNGTTYRPLDAAALTDGSIKIAALETNPLLRTNHTGQQTASTISDLAGTVQGYRLDQFTAPAATVSFNGQKISNLADPTGQQDAATKNYVDLAVENAAAGIDSKPSVRVVATSDITLSGLQTIDGVTTSISDRVLVTGKATQSLNGVYLAGTGAWTRTSDANMTGEITPGAFWFVEEGTAYGKTQWRCNNTGTISLGSTPITIVQFGAAALYAAGSGILLSGTTFSVQLASNSGLIVSGGGLSVDTTAVARKFSATITGDASTTSFIVTHNLGTQDVHVAIRDASNQQLLTDITPSTVNTVTIGFGSAPASGVTYRITVIG